MKPPIAPMLAKLVPALPDAPGWIFEPKWDGFRALVFRDREAVFIQSRDGRDLGRYFPELLAPLAAQLPSRAVLDGEIVMVRPDGLDFDALQLRLHPAASRVAALAESSPASFVLFDVLAEGGEDLRALPFAERRRRLESMLRRARPPLYLTPATDRREVAADWFARFEGAGFDGVMAKAAAAPYEPGKRTMLKVKHERDCDCVVAGFRWHRNSDRQAVGSLLLGLYDGAGHLQHVGVCSSFPAATRRAMVERLAPYRVPMSEHPWGDAAALGERRPGGQSRWSQGKDLSWEPLRPELVVEVAYDHMQGTRFRHTAQFRRWRPDKPPAACTFEQLETAPPQELQEIFAQAR
jgi:ATP-dependent DNA ligase